jgi:hypothetical protein
MDKIEPKGLALFLESLGEEYIQNLSSKSPREQHAAVSVRNFCNNLAKWSRNGTLKQSAEMYQPCSRESQHSSSPE